MNTMITLIRRELLEHRSVFVAPSVVAGIILIGAVWAVAQGLGFSAEITNELTRLDGADPARVHRMLSGFIGASLIPLWLPFNLVMSAVIAFYLLDCLHSERKDRSVLFWRSLPVSDTQTVLSKLAMGLAAIPAVELAAVLVTFVLFCIVMSFGLLALGQNPVTMLWLPAPWLSGTLFLFYVLLTQSLWFAPFAGWLLLVSAAARNGPFLWALGVPAAIAFLEYMVLDSQGFLRLIGGHLAAWHNAALSEQGGDFSFDNDDFDMLFDEGGAFEAPLSLLSLPDPVGFLTSPGLWVGLAVTALFVYGAVRMRAFHDA